MNSDISHSTRIVLTAVILAGVAQADDWPQWRGPNREGVWREAGVVDRFDSAELTPVWRTEISGGYSGPTVADGRVFVTDRITKPKQTERIICLEQKTGRKLWTHEYDCPYRDVSYDAGPRASVQIDGDRAYALGAMGNFFCLEPATGKVLWEKDLAKQYSIRMPIWGIAAAPVIEDDLIIAQIGGDAGACLVAFDTVSGKERWKALDDPASYSAPIVIDQAGKRVLVCYTGARVVGLDPKSGDLHWEQPFPARRSIIGIATPVVYRDTLFVTNFFDGSMLLKLQQDKPAVSLLWQRAGEDEKSTDALHSIIATPYIAGGHIYGVDSYGELRCLDLKTGDRVWEDQTAVPRARWATIHMTPNGDKVWMFNERGELLITKLSPKGFEELSRAKLIEPTTDQLRERGGVCWSHPAYADKHVFIRNDKEILCADLSSNQ